MTTDSAPNDPQILREEIEQTRAAPGETVEALAAKTDVKGRAQDAAARVADQAKETAHAVQEHVGDAAHAVKEQAAHAADAVGEHARSGAAAVHETIVDADIPETLRKPMPRALLAGAVAALAGGVLYVRKGGRRS